jgi:probable phosphoglycerate mutase
MEREYRQARFRPPAGAAEILLIRHGESAAAHPGRPFPVTNGRGDPALHANGQAQARAVGDRLRAAPIAAIYVTALRRTHQTAAPLAAHLGLTPMVEPDLSEVFLGDWDRGLYRVRAVEGHPAIARSIERQEWGELPGAETTAALQARVRSALLRIAARHPDALVAAFVHGGVIGAALAVAARSDAFAFNTANNGSISRLAILGDRIWVQAFNDCAHLD